MPPTRVQPLTKALISRALDRIGLAYTNCDGDLYVRIDSETTGVSLQCWFLCEGKTCRIFELACLVQPPIPLGNVAEAFAACNAFHETSRFGRLYLQPADDSEAGITLCFGSQIDVTAGVSEAFLATFITSHLASICAFLAEVSRETQLFGDHTSKPSRNRV